MKQSNITELQQQLLKAAKEHNFTSVQIGCLLQEIQTVFTDMTRSQLFDRQPATSTEALTKTGWDLLLLFAAGEVYPAVTPDPCNLETWQWAATELPAPA